MSIDRKDTISLMQAMERIKAPASFLLDTFFPKVMPTAMTTKIEVEYRKGGRKLAPYIVKGAHGVNTGREGSSIAIYQPPMLGPRRIVSPEDIEQRGFGETVYSTITPAQRAAQLQARDLSDLQGMIVNRKNKMAADILTSGSTTISGYADDGQLVTTDVVSFDWTQEAKVAKSWADAGADIYGDIKAASETIQENAGMVPTIMVVGKNIENYLLNNEGIMKWLAIPSTSNLSLMSIAPRYTHPQIRRIGLIQSLNLEIYSYAETYTDDAGETQPFLAPDDAIIAIPGRGRQLHGAVTLINPEGTGFNTYAGEYVPQYYGNRDSNQMALTVYSRVLLAPEFVDDWATIHTTTVAQG